MLTVTPEQVYAFLDKGGTETEVDFESFCAEFDPDDEENSPLDEKTFDALKSVELRRILHGSEMSENHLGGDDLVALASETVTAVKEGYEVCTWYGPKSEALVVGYRPSELKIAEE